MEERENLWGSTMYKWDIQQQKGSGSEEVLPDMVAGKANYF